MDLEPRLIVALATFAAVAWHANRRHRPLDRWRARRRRQSSSPPQWTGDLCTVCNGPCTHELGQVSQLLPDGGTGMIATYCDDHAPPGAVRVRTTRQARKLASR